MSQTRTNAIIHLPTTTDLSAQVGTVIKLAGVNSVPHAHAWYSEDQAFGVILSADAETASVAAFDGGYAGTFLAKLVEPAAAGDWLYCVNSGANVGFGSSGYQGFSGATFYAGVALEDGVAGEMIEAVPKSLVAYTMP